MKAFTIVFFIVLLTLTQVISADNPSPSLRSNRVKRYWGGLFWGGGWGGGYRPWGGMWGGYRPWGGWGGWYGR
uniref:Uncharacterized protein n=1 Tax=Parascaris univalens TaxID=6257 RepID=A0A915CGX8_PARUN